MTDPIFMAVMKDAGTVPLMTNVGQILDEQVIAMVHTL